MDLTVLKKALSQFCINIFWHIHNSKLQKCLLTYYFCYVCIFTCNSLKMLQWVFIKSDTEEVLLKFVNSPTLIKIRYQTLHEDICTLLQMKWLNGKSLLMWELSTSYTTTLEIHCNNTITEPDRCQKLCSVKAQLAQTTLLSLALFTYVKFWQTCQICYTMCTFPNLLRLESPISLTYISTEYAAIFLPVLPHHHNYNHINNSTDKSETIWYCYIVANFRTCKQGQKWPLL